VESRIQDRPGIPYIGRYGGSERMVADGCTLTSRKKTAVANRFNDRFKTAFFLSATTPSTFCKPGQFRCGSSTTCIDDSKVCDKHPDCTHGEDETKCGKYKRTWQLAVNSPSPSPSLGREREGGGDVIVEEATLEFFSALVGILAFPRVKLWIESRFEPFPLSAIPTV